MDPPVDPTPGPTPDPLDHFPFGAMDEWAYLDDDRSHGRRPGRGDPMEIRASKAYRRWRKRWAAHRPVPKP